MPLFSRGRQTTSTSRRPTLIASGHKIDPSDRSEINRYRLRQSQSAWQEPAWAFNGSVPILGFCHDYVRDSIARVRPFPALLSEDPDVPPIPLTEDTVPPGLDLDLCDQIIQRLAPFPNYMGQAAHKIDIAGECFVALLPDDDEIDGERCQVFSNRELFPQGDEWRIREYPGDSGGRPLPPDAPFWRIWQPDPEFSVLPFSHMVRLNLAAETLLQYMRLLKSLALSRIASTGKIIAIADEFSLESATGDGQAATEDAGDGETRTDPFFDDFFAAGEAAILNPESAAGVMNLVLRGPRDLIKDGINVIDVKREMEEVLIKLRDELRADIATGVNLPREIALGIGSTNHWNAEEIKTQTWENHLEPRAMNITAATTTAYYRPMLIKNGVDPDIVRRCVIGYDPTWFLGTPDLSDSADQGLKEFAVSLESWRREKGWSESDAPSDEEIQTRIGWQQQLLVRTTIREDAGSAPEEVQVAAPETKPATAPKDATVDVPTTPDTTTPTEPKPLVAAAPRDDRLDQLSGRLVNIERDGRTRLHTTVEAAVTRTLEQAGLRARNKVRTTANKSSHAVRNQHKQLVTQLDAVPESMMVSVLGKAAMEAYGLHEEELLAGALGSLEPKYRQLVTRAQKAAARAAAQATGQEIDDDQLDEATKDARNAGWILLAGGIMVLARDLLYNPHPQAPPVGEFDESTVVPIGLIRGALDAAGGRTIATPTTAAEVRAPEVADMIHALYDVPGSGATGGPDMLDLFKNELGIVADTYEWVYGDDVRTREFEPHLLLDGVTFTQMDDPQLSNDEGWPDVDFFEPGDHSGCLCTLSVSFTQADEGSGSAEEAA